jgi:hypothetical protein
MLKRLAVAAAFLCSAVAFGAEEVLYQIDLTPSGKMISRGQPTLKGTNYLFHQYPTGTLISVKKSTVKQITKMSPAAAAAANPMNQLTRIRDLPMQNVGASGSGRTTNVGRARAAAAAANAGTVGRTASPPEN